MKKNGDTYYIWFCQTPLVYSIFTYISCVMMAMEANVLSEPWKIK